MGKKEKNLPMTPNIFYELKDKHLGKVHRAAAAGDVDKLYHLSQRKKDLNKADKKKTVRLFTSPLPGDMWKTSVSCLVEKSGWLCITVTLERP